MTACDAAAKYAGHTQIINDKWGVGVVKLISPSPVNKYYPNCTYEPEMGCVYQPQFDWFAKYFANCGTCFHDIWALNLHDYSCNLADSQSLVADMSAVYPGKNIFFGELGCGGVSAGEMESYFIEFVEWAYTVPTIVGFVWAGINYVGTAGSELSVGGQIPPVGEAFKFVQANYPPILTP